VDEINLLNTLKGKQNIIQLIDAQVGLGGWGCGIGWMWGGVWGLKVGVWGCLGGVLCASCLMRRWVVWGGGVACGGVADGPIKPASTPHDPHPRAGVHRWGAGVHGAGVL